MIRKVKNYDEFIQFSIEQVQDSDFYGIEVDKNHLYLLDNGIVTSNSNGKSRCANLISQAFGDYWTEMNVALLTRPRTSSSAASPEVMDLKGKRIVTVQEPEQKDRLNMGIIKQYTGGDTISARQLHKEQEKFILQCKIFFSCNAIPRVECSDGGTWRRLKICEFRSKFVTEPKKSHEFPRDPLLDKRIRTWGPAFLSILIEYWESIKQSGGIIREPVCVKEYTQEFRRDSDFFAQFVEDSLVEDFSQVTEFVVIHECYRNWCSEHGIRPDLYTKQEIKKLIGDLFGREKVFHDKSTGNYTKGFTIALKNNGSVFEDS